MATYSFTFLINLHSALSFHETGTMEMCQQSLKCGHSCDNKGNRTLKNKQCIHQKMQWQTLYHSTAGGGFSFCYNCPTFLLLRPGWARKELHNEPLELQGCQPLRFGRNYYAIWTLSTPLRLRVYVFAHHNKLFFYNPFLAFLCLNIQAPAPVFISVQLITLRAKLSGAVYCNRSCLFVDLFCSDNSKLRALIFTKLGF